MKAVSPDLRQAASAMLKEISSRLGIQVLMITHEKALVEAADKVFEVSQSTDDDGWGVSEVKVLENDKGKEL